MSSFEVGLTMFDYEKSLACADWQMDHGMGEWQTMSSKDDGSKTYASNVHGRCKSQQQEKKMKNLKDALHAESLAFGKAFSEFKYLKSGGELIEIHSISSAVSLHTSHFAIWKNLDEVVLQYLLSKMVFVGGIILSFQQTDFPNGKEVSWDIRFRLPASKHRSPKSAKTYVMTMGVVIKFEFLVYQSLVRVNAWEGSLSEYRYNFKVWSCIFTRATKLEHHVAISVFQVTYWTVLPRMIRNWVGVKVIEKKMMNVPDELRPF